jgi:hypothetical protein
MKTQSKQLNFNKRDILELESSELNNIVGGSLGDLVDFIGGVVDVIEAVDNFIDNISVPQV